MSELKNMQCNHGDFRLRLLATVSALTLIGVSYGTERAVASDDARPTVWIELGGQLEGLTGADQRFAPPFLLATPTPAPYKPVSPLDAEHAPRYSHGVEGKISFSPEDSNWVFSASLRYGRSNGTKHVHQQTGVALPSTSVFKTILPSAIFADFADTKAQHDESHAILDFQAGREVGLGVIGPHGTSQIKLGVRFAQFSAKSEVNIHARYDVVPLGGPVKYFHTHFLSAQSNRSFHGVGPSINWDASTPVFGNGDDGGFSLDWGANAAVLFGRQKTLVHHQSSAQAFLGKYTYQTLYRHTGAPPRSHSVTIPNVGGFAALSLRFPNAKVSLGYRADFFFGAIDNGIDTRKSQTLGFNGPFATISVGLGG